MAILDSLINIGLVLFILVVLVVIHEFGHFLTARLANVRVHEFGIGFPPRARIFARDKETIYTLNWLPIGGFVRLEGEEGESEDPRAFVSQPLHTRIVILLSGVAMNFVLAWVIFAFMAGIGEPTATLQIGEVPSDAANPSPAQQAGIVGGTKLTEGDPNADPPVLPTYDRSGDRILAIDGQRFLFYFGPDAPIRYLQEHAGRPVSLTIRHANGVEETKVVTLRSAAEAAERGSLGIRVSEFIPEDVRYDAAGAVGIGLRRTLQASTLVLSALRDLVTNIANPQVSGPIGIVQAVGIVRAQEQPGMIMLFLVGLLSANLAVINALPLPPMDGGRIAMGVIQAITRNRISVSAERATYLVGFVLLFAFLIWISYFDLLRLGGGGS